MQNSTRPLLGIDLGRRFCGVALCPRDDLILPLSPIPMDLPHATKAISSIAAYVREYDIAGIVVGVPRNVDGSLSSTAHAQETWHKQLATNIPVPVVFVDEFSSTQEGQDRYPEIDKDTAAAMVILERFLHA